MKRRCSMKLLPNPQPPTTIAEYCERTGWEPSDDVLLAASYLQARGWVFGVNFDHTNALELAEELCQLSAKPKEGESGERSG